jgi:hypothetical protein
MLLVVGIVFDDVVYGVVSPKSIVEERFYVRGKNAATIAVVVVVVAVVARRRLR